MVCQYCWEVWGVGVRDRGCGGRGGMVTGSGSGRRTGARAAVRVGVWSRGDVGRTGATAVCQCCWEGPGLLPGCYLAGAGVWGQGLGTGTGVMGVAIVADRTQAVILPVWGRMDVGVGVGVGDKGYGY